MESSSLMISRCRNCRCIDERDHNDSSHRQIMPVKIAEILSCLLMHIYVIMSFRVGLILRRLGSTVSVGEKPLQSTDGSSHNHSFIDLQ